jgi:hypothetical protein
METLRARRLKRESGSSVDTRKERVNCVVTVIAKPGPRPQYVIVSMFATYGNATQKTGTLLSSHLIMNQGTVPIHSTR